MKVFGYGFLAFIIIGTLAQGCGDQSRRDRCKADVAEGQYAAKFRGEEWAMARCMGKV